MTARAVKRSLWLGGLAAAAAAGLVSAQPAPPPGPVAAPPDAAPPPPPFAAPPPVLEEAPPQEAPAPAPVIVPPITEEEIAPALPPEAAVFEDPGPPPRRTRYDVAVLTVLEKVTAETLVFTAPVGKPVRYKGLIFTVRACERSTPDEPVQDSIAYLIIDSQPKPEDGRPTPPAKQVYKGWMYAAWPGLHPLQHPAYDAWVVGCRSAAPPVETASR